MNAIAERRDAVVTMSRQGRTGAQIAGALGVTDRTVARDRVAMSLSKIAPAAMTQAQIDQARALLADGCSYAETGRTVGINGLTVSRHIPGYGWSATESGTWGAFIRRSGGLR